MGSDPNKDVPVSGRGAEGTDGHTFSSLDFEGVTVKSPYVVIIPDKIGSKDANNGESTDNRARRMDDPRDAPDMLIGMDVLKKLHLYIAFNEEKIYISPGEAALVGTSADPIAAQVAQ